MSDQEKHTWPALPEYVMTCRMCNGKGEHRQMYNYGHGNRGMSEGPCSMCCDYDDRWKGHGTGFVYKSTGKPVPQSVADQIAHSRIAAALKHREGVDEKAE